jgi:hypothetical protein
MGIAHDVSAELRGEHGKWTKGGEALKRMAGEAAKTKEGGLKAGDKVKYKTGSLGTVHHIDDKGKVHVVWDRGRGRPVATPAHHLTSVTGEKQKAATAEKSAREVARDWRAEKLAEIGHPVPAKPAVHQPADVRFGVKLTEADRKRSRQAIYHASTIQAESTPDIVGKTTFTVLKNPSYRGGGSSNTLAAHSGRLHEVTIKPEVMTGSNAQRILENGQKTNHWIPADKEHDLATNVMIHEYGHGVHAEMVDRDLMQSLRGGKDTIKTSEQEFWNAFAKTIGASMPPMGKDRGRPAMKVNFWFGQNRDKIAKAVSRYGASSLNEMLAELWAEYKLSSNPRPPAKLYGDFAMSKLGGK